MFASGSLKLFEIAGTTVRVHLTFFLLLIWLGAVFWLQKGPGEALYGILFILILFACVVLHEFGHILAARRYGIRTPDVTLLPIGGVASLERMPQQPQREIFVAIAGPLVNLAIAGVLILGLGGKIDFEQLSKAEHIPRNFVAQIAVANLVLFVFNLVPAFPMDGGRVLRALLAFKLGHRKATKVAARTGQVFAIGFGVLGLMGNPILVLVALFIFLAAGGEAGQVEMHALTKGYLAGDAMITKYESLGPRADLNAAVEKLIQTTQQEFPIVDDVGLLRGMLSRDQLVKGLSKSGGQTPVLDVMTRDVPEVASDTGLEKVFELMQQKKSSVIAVKTPERRFAGYISTENLSELFLVRAALGSEEEDEMGQAKT